MPLPLLSNPWLWSNRLDRLFNNLHEYLAGTLDILVCMHAAAAVDEQGALLVRLQGGTGADEGGASTGKRPAAAGGPGGSGQQQGCGGGVWPLYVANDVNLIQLLETFRLVMDY